MKRNTRSWVLTEEQLAKRRTLPTEGLLFESPAECQTNDSEEASRRGGGINGVTGQRYDRRGRVPPTQDRSAIRAQTSSSWTPRSQKDSAVK